jgi:hypothetical protein
VELTENEKQLVYIGLIDKTTYFENFLLGPSFHLPFKQVILTRLDAATLHLKDAYLACGGFFLLVDGIEVPGVTEEVNFERASSALATFRSLKVSNSHELSIFLSLTLASVVFAEVRLIRLFLSHSIGYREL